MTEPLEARLRRLKEERDEADRRYNEALTALDRALAPPPALPEPPAAFDEHQITPLNESWNILPAPPQGPGLKGRLAGFVWRTIAPYLERQLTFNSRLVDHINRNVAAHRDAGRALDGVRAALAEHTARQAEISARLMMLQQQVTAYVDTKDRESAQVLNGALSAFAESLHGRLESMAAREQRAGVRADALARQVDGFKASVAIAQQAAASLKREVERLAESGVPASPASGSAAAPPDEAFSARLDAYKYVGFEDRFRGSREAIEARLASYLPLFDGAPGVVLDVGCGRGEFLDLLASRGLRARGIDLNAGMVEVCAARGLDVSQADAVGYLSAAADGSLGGIFAAQVVEHLEPAYLLRFLELAFHKLAPGGRLVLETLNPACWVAFFESYIRDITHAWPLHPETLQFLVTASGFPDAAIEYRSPVPPEDRLQAVPVPAGAEPWVADFADTFNGNVATLNARLFTYLDYAVVATR